MGIPSRLNHLQFHVDTIICLAQGKTWPVLRACFLTRFVGPTRNSHLASKLVLAEPSSHTLLSVHQRSSLTGGLAACVSASSLKFVHVVWPELTAMRSIESSHGHGSGIESNRISVELGRVWAWLSFACMPCRHAIYVCTYVAYVRTFCSAILFLAWVSSTGSAGAVVCVCVGYDTSIGIDTY